MVIQNETFNEMGQAFRRYGEPDRERQDEDERISRRSNTRGVIIGVEDAASGSILARTIENDEKHALIKRYRYPIPREGDEVEIFLSVDGKASAEPIGPELPPNFLARVVIAQAHGGIVEHLLENVDGDRRVFARASVGVDMAVGAVVQCCVNYLGLVAETDMAQHEIVAVSLVKAAPE